MLFRLAVIVTVPSKGSSAERVSVFPDLETDTLLLELEKLNSARTPFVSVKVRLYFPSLYSRSCEATSAEPDIKLGMTLCRCIQATI